MHNQAETQKKQFQFTSIQKNLAISLEGLGRRGAPKEKGPQMFAPIPFLTRSKAPLGCTINSKHKRNGPD